MKRRRVTAGVREKVARAARYRCGYCLTSQVVVGPILEIEHIIPEARGGTSDEDNLWLACPLCNSHKADRIDAQDPLNGAVVRLFDPRRERWAEHFEWAEDGAVIVGSTPTGRATVELLQMNHPDLVAARRLWIIVGWHPPRDS